MNCIDLSLDGLKLLQPKIFHDERGFFLESYRHPLYASFGIDCEFIQDNLSFSKHGVLRGMHFQMGPGQAKLVSVIDGEIFDVAVDIRPNSKNFKKWVGVKLNSQERKQLFIPAGFAHGFCVLSETATVSYKVNREYDPNLERSFRYDDPEIGIQWPVATPILSSKDQTACCFKDL